MNVISEFNFVKGEAYQHCTCIICPAFKSLITSKKSEITTKSKNKQSKKQQKIEKEFEYYKNIYLRVFKSKEILKNVILLKEIKCIYLFI